MTTRLERLTRPLPGTSVSVRTAHRRVGYTLAALGLAAAMVSGVANLVAAGQIGGGEGGASAGNLAWSFGLNTAAFGTIKLAIATVLAGILVRQPLPIHRMAKRLWAPILVMGYMAVIVGFFISLALSGDPADVALESWTQGFQFLGEGLLLAGISFLLGAILASLREGGGEVQKDSG